MAEPLTLEQVRHVAHLARLALTDEELDRFLHQLGAVLRYVEHLDELDTSGVEPTAHPLPLSNVLRADQPAPTLTPDQALANAPAHDRGCFRLPKVLDQDSA